MPEGEAQEHNPATQSAYDLNDIEPDHVLMVN